MCNLHTTGTSDECMFLKWTCRLLSGYKAAFWLCLGNINPWDLVTALLSPFAKIPWHASNPYSPFIFHTLPPSSPLVISPSPFHSRTTHNSRELVFIGPRWLALPHVCCPGGFSWDKVVVLFEHILHCVCSPYKEWPCAWRNVKCFFVLGLPLVHAGSLSVFVNMNFCLSCVVEAASRPQPVSWHVICFEAVPLVYNLISCINFLHFSHF